MLLPHVPHALPEAEEGALVRGGPGVRGRRRVGEALNVGQRGGEQLSGAQVETVDLQQSDREKGT